MLTGIIETIVRFFRELFTMPDVDTDLPIDQPREPGD